MAASEQSWQAIVRDGALTDTGMIAFGDRLDDNEIEAIRTYVLRQACLAVENGHAEAPDLAVAGDQ